MKSYEHRIEELTTSEIIEKYGEILNEEQIKELKRIDQHNKVISKIDVEDLHIEVETLKKYLKTISKSC